MSEAHSRVSKLGGLAAPPVIRVTSYDRIWSTLVALLAVLIVAVWFLFLVWDSFRPHVAVGSVVTHTSQVLQATIRMLRFFGRLRSFCGLG